VLGGLTFLDGGATAETATFTNEGGTGGGIGGRTAFLGTSTAAGATLIGNAGSGGGEGGAIQFFDDSTGGSAVVQHLVAVLQYWPNHANMNDHHREHREHRGHTSLGIPADDSLQAAEPQPFQT